ncbi:MAG TPA: GWxTD domain-containing protein [Gemmatimonadales bacterium]|jgi:GWxTD domain-containing protein
MPAERLPELFDPTLVYREMGLLTDNGPLGVIGNARILAGSSRDSLQVIVGLSMRNRGLTFQRQGEEFVAEYQADVALKRGNTVVSRTQRDERVRVSSFRETQRADESIIFQSFVTAAPGDYVLDISIRDRNGANASHVETPISVPSLQSSAVALPISVYQATPRTSLTEQPALVMNPRIAVDYGVDTLHFYVETYNAAAGSKMTLEAVDGTGHTSWLDTLRIDSLRPVAGFVVSIPPATLSIGRYELHLSQGGNVMAETPFLVAFSDQYAAGNLQDIVSLLRYFAPPDTLKALLNAPPEERGAAWLHFWKSTDPNPATPENEGIEEYLHRVQIANERFRDEGVPGWLTERGEVFITIGEPSEILDRRADTQGRGRFIQWTYYDLRLTLTFFDDTGFGRFRLDPRSRSEFQHVSNRQRM